MTVSHMIPTHHYRMIATGDRVYGGGQCLGVRVQSYPREMITYHPVLDKSHSWTRQQAGQMHGYYEAEA